jgi:hypothetical protein
MAIYKISLKVIFFNDGILVIFQLYMPSQSIKEVFK